MTKKGKNFDRSKRKVCNLWQDTPESYLFLHENLEPNFEMVQCTNVRVY